MKIAYDFHIHSCLSPCADDDMTPSNIVGFAKLCGLDMIAISDHNEISNVETAMKIGNVFGVTVVPAVELQTVEDIHVLCLFKKFEDLKNFFENIEFFKIENKSELFGRQLVVDENDEILEEKKNLLLVSSNVEVDDVFEKVDSFGGIAIPAHVNREDNGMFQILGDIPPEFKVVEVSKNAYPEEIGYFARKYKVLLDSDAHTLENIQKNQFIELENNSVDFLFEWFKK